MTLRFRNACLEFGWLLGLAGFVMGIVALFLVYTSGLARQAGVPGAGSEIHVVATTGEQGYPVTEFCNDPLTSVTKGLIAPPDSLYVATYTLDRTRDSVHETVEVGVYADAARQPHGTHYSSDNRPTDGFVSRNAMDCIVKKAR